MSISISLTEDNVYKALGDFLRTILPASAEIVVAQTNRVPPPAGIDYVTMTTMLQQRLATNIDAAADALFMGTISGNTLTISQVFFGTIGIGAPVFGVGVAAGTLVTALGTGTGGVGTYTISGAPQSIASERIAAGRKTLLMPGTMTVQLDVHGPNSSNNAVIITGAFRDAYAVEVFAASGFDIVPLYTSDARQLPFVNDSQQVENRWVIDAVMQINPVLTVPQQYADSATVAIVNVDEAYPP